MDDELMEFINEKIKDLDFVRDNVKPRFVPIGYEMLENTVVRHYLGLPYIFGVEIFRFDNGEGITRAVVSYPMLEMWGISENELDIMAIKNVYPIVLKMDELLKAFDPEFPLPEESHSWVLTTEEKTYGAVSILCRSARELLSMLGEDLWLIPSSVHEWIIFPMKFCDAEHIRAMISDVNHSELAPCDILSYDVFSYLHKSDSIQHILQPV